MNEYLKAATAAARQAGKIFVAAFGKPKRITKKGGDYRSLVTEIDRELEKLIKSRLHKKFPGHDILGEESGLSKFHKKNGFKWFIDPIDGTTNYIQGLPLCCISIALWDGQGPLVGVVYNPVLNQLFTAARGRGTFLNGKKIKVSQQTNLQLAFGGFGWGRDAAKAAKNFPKVIKATRKIRTLGSSTLEQCYVAMGVFDFHIQAAINIWDFGAGILLIKEAGGKVTDWQGAAPNEQTVNLIASNGRLHQKLLKKTKKLSV